MKFDTVITGGGSADAELALKSLHEGKNVCLIIFGGRVGDVHAYDEFVSEGGTLLYNHRVTGVEFSEDGSVLAVHTDKLGATPLTAETYILASGRFVSGGLMADMESVREPIFGSDVQFVRGHENWTSPDFFAAQPFEAFGVVVDGQGRVLRGGKVISNLYGYGDILAESYRSK